MKNSILDAQGARRIVNAFKRRHAVTHVIEIAVGLIVFATLGFAALQILATASTTGFSTSVATIAVTVTSILAALAVAVGFYKKGGRTGL